QMSQSQSVPLTGTKRVSQLISSPIDAKGVLQKLKRKGEQACASVRQRDVILVGTEQDIAKMERFGAHSNTRPNADEQAFGPRSMDPDMVPFFYKYLD
ncbi:MAG: hypothetical protein KGH63_02895, partial [Candidatus Micrarchaeota archaeon]|nr:hypothetical protein [Candidatus Micrarchaeota archaeon]